MGLDPSFESTFLLNVFPYSLIANNKTHFSVLYHSFFFFLFHMSLLSCSLFKIAYSHVFKKKKKKKKNLDGPQKSVPTHITYLHVYWGLFRRHRFESRLSHMWVKIVRGTAKLIRFM